MGCSSGKHSTYANVICIDYAGGYAAAGAPNPIEKQMNDFLKEPVEFKNMPKDVRSWAQVSKITVHENFAEKVVTRTCKMNDNTEVVLEETFAKEFSLKM